MPFTILFISFFPFFPFPNPLRCLQKRGQIELEGISKENQSYSSDSRQAQLSRCHSWEMSSLFLELSRDRASAASQTIQSYCFVIPYIRNGFLVSYLDCLWFILHQFLLHPPWTWRIDCLLPLPHPFLCLSTSVIVFHRVFLFLKSLN